MPILQNFCAISGQTPNLSKSSIIFSRNVDSQSKKEVKNFFPVNDLLPNMIYLGHPLIFNHSDRCKAYDFIINKFRAKLNKLKSNKLNHAGRLTYINSVLASIPIYYMSTILFTKNFIDKITAIVRKFWWAGVQDENASTSFHFRSWKDICRPKVEGGLGIRDLFTVNKSLILNAAWKIATGKNQFLSEVLKAKYYPNTSFWKSGNHSTKSAFWASVTSVKNVLLNNCIVQVHRGNSSIWSTPWCDIWKEIYDHIKLPVTVNNLPSRIADLWDSNNLTWNDEAIESIFDNHATNSIKKVKTVPSTDDDKIVWKPSKNGDCTAHNAFFYLNSLSRLQLPQQGPRSINQDNLNILNRVWKCKTIPPVIKTFIWRLIRRAIATGARANSLTEKIDKSCALCGAIENDVHLFFHCDFARSVWFSSTTPLLSSSLPNEEDGVQECLQKIINSKTPEDILTQVVTYLWFWKARNDRRFRQRNWSVLQVHLAVKAHIQTYNAALLKEQSQHLHRQNKNDNGTNEIREPNGSSHNSCQCRFTDGPEEVRCYTDASIDPGVSIDSPKEAGLGIHIQEVKTKVTYHFKIRISQATSVVMAEAAAIAFAANIASNLGYDKIIFYTDNQSLVNYLNGHTTSWLPSWDSKPFTQMFINCTTNRRSQVLKIPSSRNTIAHSLAKAAATSTTTSLSLMHSCNNAAHVNICPLKEALCNIHWDSVPTIAAYCC